MAETNIAYGVDSFEISSNVWEEVLPQHAHRQQLIIQNRGNNNVFIGFTDDDDEDLAIRLQPGGFFEPLVVPTNQIRMIAGGISGTTVTVISNTQADLGLD